jgi:hypothetical protein
MTRPHPNGEASGAFENRANALDRFPKAKSFCPYAAMVFSLFSDFTILSSEAAGRRN